MLPWGRCLLTSPPNPFDPLAGRRKGVFRALGVSALGAAVNVASVWLAQRDSHVATSDVIASNNITPTSEHAGDTRRALVPEGRLVMGANDWEALGKAMPIEQEVPAFEIDVFEVTYRDWQTCSSCAQRLPPQEDTVPVTHISPTDAELFCKSRGGRLPTHVEWMWAASSGRGFRYPWGQTGLVCRRAAYAMVGGPCEQHASGPNSVGSRPAGATPNGIYDLTGNVAEWVTDGDAIYAVGGSFRSTLAGQLKVWSREVTTTPRDDIGFRCVYPVQLP